MAKWLIKYFSQNTKRLLLVLAITGFIFFLFRPAFSAYFFQDDWFSLSISQARTIPEFLQFFAPRTDLIYYRPLGMQIPFFLIQSFFGINPLPFRFATVIVHLLNGWLAYRLLNYFLKDNILAIFGSAFYLTSAAQLTIFYWAATFAFVLAPTFYFGSFLLFVNGKRRLSLVVFLAGLLANELIVTLPLTLLLWSFLYKQPRRRNQILLFGFISLMYLLFRVVIATPQMSEDYQSIHNVKELLINIRDYFLWSLNWPEEIHNQFVSFSQLNRTFLKDFHSDVLVFTANTITLTLVIIAPVFILLRKKVVPQGLVTPNIFGGVWFLLTLLPVLFFSGHSFAYYVPIPLWGILFMSLISLKSWYKFAADNSRVPIISLILLFIVWYAASFQNVKFTTHVHWAPRRANLSRNLINLVTSRYPQLPENAVIVLPKSDENMLALAGDHALQVIYHSYTLHTFYGSRQDYFDLQHRMSVKNGDFEKILFEIY